MFKFPSIFLPNSTISTFTFYCTKLFCLHSSFFYLLFSFLKFGALPPTPCVFAIFLLFWDERMMASGRTLSPANISRTLRGGAVATPPQVAKPQQSGCHGVLPWAQSLLWAVHCLQQRSQASRNIGKLILISSCPSIF